MPRFRFLVSLVIFATFSLSGCITLPGHRIIVDDENFYLHVETPSKEIRRNIQFNESETALLKVPERVHIKLIVIENGDKHRIDIEGKHDGVVYLYRINGKEVQFYPNGEKYFASQVPRIMSEMGYKRD